MSKVIDGDAVENEIEVQPSKVMVAFSCLAPFIFMGFLIFSEPLKHDAKFSAIYGEFLDLNINRILFALFFAASLFNLFGIRVYRVSSHELRVWKFIFPKRVETVMVSDLDRIYYSRLPRFINAAHKSVTIKLKNGRKLSIPYNYINSHIAVELLSQSIKKK